MISFIVLGLLAFSAFGLPTQREALNDRDQQLAVANNNVAVDLLKNLPKQKNLFISPLSIFTALSMLYAGARGDTAQEMRAALGLEKANLEDSDVHLAFRKLLDQLLTPSDEYTLDVANKALSSSNIPVLDEYKHTLEQYYRAELEEANFQRDGEAIKNNVNQWVNEKTRGKISTLLDSPPDPSTLMILLNAVYFKGTWKTQFEERKTKPATFYNNGRQVSAKRVPMMHLEKDSNYTYSQQLQSKFLELPYVGDHLSMIFILPERRDGLEDLERRLTPENLQEAIERLRKTPSVDIKIPKFKLEEDYKLKNVLQQIGLTKVFGSQANLSGISESAPLTVSEVIHKAVVEVNEEGSEAAAVTGIVIEVTSSIVQPSKPTFHADHPFLFAIRDQRTGLLLFLGRVNNL